MVGACVVACIFCSTPGFDGRLSLPFLKNINPNLGWFYVVFAVVIVGASNAVNLTDGLDRGFRRSSPPRSIWFLPMSPASISPSTCRFPMKIFANQGAADTAIVNGDDPLYPPGVGGDRRPGPAVRP